MKYLPLLLRHHFSTAAKRTESPPRNYPQIESSRHPRKCLPACSCPLLLSRDARLSQMTMCKQYTQKACSFKKNDAHPTMIIAIQVSPTSTRSTVSARSVIIRATSCCLGNIFVRVRACVRACVCACMCVCVSGNLVGSPSAHRNGLI